MKKVFIGLFAVTCILLFISCTLKDPSPAKTQQEIFLHQQALKAYEYALNANIKREKALEDYIASMTDKQRVSQLFVVNLQGNSNFKPVEKDYIPGGYLFFGYNLGNSEEDVIKFTDSIISYCKDNNETVPFLSIDQEGGLVNRLKNICGPLPSEKRVAEYLTEDEAEELYGFQSRQMYELGLKMNLAPVVEALTDENKSFLNQRSFGSAENVKLYGPKCISAYEDKGVSAVIKHFPGNSNVDPHTGLPVLKYTHEELDETLDIFRCMIESNPAGVLMSHAVVPVVDDKTPSCLSKKWVTDILRNQLGFNGIVFSDDIFMAALAKNGYSPEIAVVKALEAGIDCIMISEKKISSSVDLLINKSSENPELDSRIYESVKRLIEYKIRSGLMEYELYRDGEYHLKIKENQQSLEERVKDFQTAKASDEVFYMEHF